MPVVDNLINLEGKYCQFYVITAISLSHKPVHSKLYIQIDQARKFGIRLSKSVRTF